MLTRLVAAATAALTALAGPALSQEGASHGASAMHAGHSSLPRHTPRFNRERAVVAVLAYNPATEVTDFVVPYGILAESGVADVVAIATAEGRIQMSPALRFRAQATTRHFDARFPQGADYVIVPNIYDGKNDPLVLDWIRLQADRGAVIVGICDGVPVLANAGLLEGRRATGHWRTIDGLERKHPGTQWLRNTRYVADGNVITTSGVSASIPISVALVEAIGGREPAEKVAKFLGVTDWSAAHDSEQFKLDAASVFTVLRNKAMFWRHEALGLEVARGADEISVALIADAYARTRRSQVLSVSRSAEPVLTRRGLLLVPDRVADGPKQPDRMLSRFETLPPALTLDRSLEGIAASYGQATADFVALTMEYPYKQTSAAAQGNADRDSLLGAGLRSRPRHDGSDRQTTDLVPVVRYSRGPWFARTTHGLLEGGPRFALAGGLRAGAQLAHEAGPRDGDPGASLGAHLEWNTKIGPAPLNALARFRSHLDAERGKQLDARLTLGVYESGGLRAGLFGQATWADDKHFLEYYGLRDSGLLFTSVGALGSYELSRRWVAVASAELRRLADQPARSAFVQDRTSSYVTLGAAYRF